MEVTNEQVIFCGNLDGVVSMTAGGLAFAKGPGGPGGMPPGFSKGNASWKQGPVPHTPPGWSKGKKKGWGCRPGTRGCVPPGLR